MQLLTIFVEIIYIFALTSPKRSRLFFFLHKHHLITFESHIFNVRSIAYYCINNVLKLFFSVYQYKDNVFIPNIIFIPALMFSSALRNFFCEDIEKRNKQFTVPSQT